MKLSIVKNSISYLLLALFLSMKMAGIHSLTHSDESDDAIYCAICDSSIDHNLTPTLVPNSIDFEVSTSIFIVYKKIANNYNFSLSKNTKLRKLLSRPPPSLV
ncbi:hypothetical protein BXQ17_05010 [Polaribacter sp. BM10]|uniref:hypothetical protein n=1 Tax=Polaribacter sp. BM10 TaxID=1529069 RepID=UPI00098BA96F|nr:hypothetical protein [Polaribacter sp. BM10]AQS93484.1 hypothetical protein BXQ17_05010 [Polaribacter sp. BM10]